MTLRFLSLAALCFTFAVAAAGLRADPVTHHFDVDFGRVVSSRNLSGLAARSDGRLVAGPTITNLGADLPPMLWTLAPAGSDRWLLGSGPDGKIFEVKIVGAMVTTAPVIDLDESQVFAVLALPDGRFLAGTSPEAALYLIANGKPVARLGFPADSIFDLAQLDRDTVLVATGNPGRIYRVDLARFGAAGVSPKKTIDPAALAKAGATLFGEIRDRNVRRLLVSPPERVLAGSSPSGNIYAFPRSGGAPFVLYDAKEAEVTDLLGAADGSIYAALVFGASAPERRIPPPPKLASPPGEPGPSVAALPPPQPSRVDFSGRSEIIRLTPQGFAETIVARNGVAVYRLAQQGDLVLMAAGENGELLGYDPAQKLVLTFAGSDATQCSGLFRLDDHRYLVLKNNFPGLAVLDFAASGIRAAETQKLDLGQPGVLGAVRFSRLVGLDPSQLDVEFRFSNNADETEGWSPWRRTRREDETYYLPDARGRYVKLRLSVPAAAAVQECEIGRATLFYAPQNHAPQVQDFRLLPPNLGLVPAPDMPPPSAVALAQLLFPNQPPPGARENQNPEIAKNSFLGSQVFRQPGNQLVYWSVNDNEGDNLACTLDLRRSDSTEWTTVAAEVTTNYASFSTSQFPDGVYLVRLTVSEQAPRPEAERLSTSVDADDLVIDHTPPEIVDAKLFRTPRFLRVTVRAKDALSLLRGVELVFNQGNALDLTTPVDGILDSRDETFEMEVPLETVAGATNVEISAVDSAGNRSSRRVKVP